MFIALVEQGEVCQPGTPTERSVPPRVDDRSGRTAMTASIRVLQRVVTRSVIVCSTRETVPEP